MFANNSVFVIIAVLSYIVGYRYRKKHPKQADAEEKQKTEKAVETHDESEES